MTLRASPVAAKPRAMPVSKAAARQINTTTNAEPSTNCNSRPGMRSKLRQA
jgi:hypothetical protein